MLIVMLVTFCIQIITVQAGGVFGTVALSFIDWLKIFAGGISLIVFNEAYKLFLRRTRPARAAQNAVVGKPASGGIG